MGSTITLLVREMKKRGMKLTPLDSTVLLIGLYEDTGHLSYPSTRSEDAAAAAYLLENSADLNVAARFLNPPYEEPQRDILFSMMKDTMTFQHKGYSVGLNIIKLDRKIPMLAGIVSMYRKIINTDAVFVILINDKKSSTVIGRSGVDRIDIGKIMKHFGGGGHPAAGSATVKSIDFDPEALKNEIIAKIQEDRTSGATIADLMSFPVSSVSPETPLKQVRDMMQEQKIRGILIIEDEKLLGIIVLWDFKKLKKDKQWYHPVKAFMIRDVATIPPNMAPSQAARIMVDKNIGHLPVEHKGRIIGIVTRTDILAYFYSLSG
jgi:tRNA nucleotidyltransferase (CCA-adding enzyme)